MYTNTVRLPYTLWYDGKDKIFRMDMNAILSEEHYEDGKKYVGKIRNVQVGGYNVDGDIQPPPDGNHSYLEVTEFATAVYNEQKHYVDITLKSFPSFNADGEIALYIDYELAKGIEEYITDYSYQKKEVTVSQEALTAALTENVVTETIKPTLDKSYYSKQEVDQLIQQLRQELTAGTHTEDHPQQ